MIFLTLIVWVSYVFLFVFITLCLACGLYYIAEVVEEYSVWAKRVIRYAIFGVLAIHVLLLLFEDLPVLYLLIGLLSHGVYHTLLPSFPVIDFTDPRFIAGCAMAVINHFSWFYFFMYNYYPFNEILAFFIICVWLIPFGYFVSLSASENMLPSEAYGQAGPGARRKDRKGVNRLLSFFNFVKDKRSEMLPGLVGSNTVKLT